MNRSILKLSAWVLLSLFVPSASFADADYSCEVMSVEGQASVKEGDILKAGDTVETGADGTVDVAYDKEWKNVVRVLPNSNVTIGSVHPSSVVVSRGTLYARLKELPTQSTFEVETPTAIAAVRGSEYLTHCPDGSATDVHNFSESEVLVFGLDDAGRLSGEPLTLRNLQATAVDRRGASPKAMRPLTEGERGNREKIGGVIEKRAEALRGAGRFGRIQDVRKVSQDFRRTPPPPRPGSQGPQGEAPNGSPNFARRREKMALERGDRVGEDRIERQDERRNEGLKKRKRRRPKPPQDGGPNGPTGP